MPEFEFKTIDTVVHRPSSDWNLWIYLPLIEANSVQMSLQCLNTAAATNSKLDYSGFLENKQTQTLAKLTFSLLIKLPNEISEVKRRSWKWNFILQTLNNLDSYLKFVLKIPNYLQHLEQPGRWWEYRPESWEKNGKRYLSSSSKIMYFLTFLFLHIIILIIITIITIIIIIIIISF